MVFVHTLKSSPKLFDHANGFSIDWHQCDVLDLEHFIGNYSAILNMKKLSTFKWFRMRVKTLQHKLHQRIPTIKIQITG